ncbi:hypothetical protein QYM36_018088 [Artemia franciscana]|uniref:Endophilin-A n=1 Tax=Artemia franciscana TaxID=6661 RepID=A0AA88H7H6_ARTSF|nr:hypothetical protein QYM36_018088 [Artemia franciscana]
MVGDLKMATESKGTIFAKTVQKHAGRAKEKILQKVGKVDRTADEIFDDHVQNFTKQHMLAKKLQTEVNNYVKCIKEMRAASKSLYECIGEVYEPDWTGHDLLYLQTQTVDMLWQDLAHKVTDQVLIPLNTYQAHFPEMRKKIEKRNRKLVDYDSQRHSYQSLETMQKKRDQGKISKSKELVDEAKRTFGIINSELNDELPALHDSRILFYVTNLQTFFSAEQVFHSELAKVHSELETIIEKLSKENQRTVSTTRRISAANGASPVTPVTPNSTSSPIVSTPEAKEEVLAGHYEEDFPPPPHDDSIEFMSTPFKQYDEPAPPVIRMNEEVIKIDIAADDVDSLHAGVESARIKGATTEDLPPGVLYRVRAAYKYDPEDEDELQLEIGDIVRVIEYEDPEEQEEGWLMGIKESTGQKGLFPANFTRPI